MGAAAAPTAGLHFTKELLEKIAAKGVKVSYVTLHVGLGTFRPVKEDEIEAHEMHSEFCIVPEETAAAINETKKNGGRVLQSARHHAALAESFAKEDGALEACSGWTNIFIYPGYRFKCIDALVTNFHLPESTAYNAGVRVGWTRAYHERVQHRSKGEVPLLLIRRCDVH